MSSQPAYTILHAPRMTAAGFRAVLRRHGSPAAAEAAACYAAIVATGVDPAVALAVFQHESNYGRAGIATRNRSWGNIRNAATHQFIRYATWTGGAAGIGRLLALYGRNGIRAGVDTSTTQTFPYVWAPASDGNAPDRYGDAVSALVASWSRLYPVHPTAAAGYLDAAGVPLFRLRRGRAIAAPERSATVHAYIGPTAHYKPNATLARILTGKHHGRYVRPGSGIVRPVPA